MSANPFRTLPAYLVTNPTTIPPAALVAMGINVVYVHPSHILLLVVLVVSVAEEEDSDDDDDVKSLSPSMTALAAHNSILNW